MKKLHWILIAIGAVYICGILSGHLITKAFIKQPDTVVENMKDTTWTATQVPPSRDTTITIPKPDIIVKSDFTDYDTIKTEVTDIKDSIEVKTQITNISDSLLFFANKQRYYQPFTIGIVADNFYGYKIMETPRNVIVDTRSKVPFIKFYGNLAVLVSTQKSPLSEIECGFTIKQRFSLFGRISAGGEGEGIDVKSMLGVRIWL